MIKACWKEYRRRKIGEKAFWEQQGARIGQNFSCIGKINMGSEPYLIKIGDNVRFSSDCKIVTHDGAVHVLRNQITEWKDADLFGKVTIGNNVFIGMSSILLPGTEIGDNCIIAAGSIVKTRVPSNTVFGGVPARKICNLDEYKAKNKDKIVHTKFLDKVKKKEFIEKNILNKKDI